MQGWKEPGGTALPLMSGKEAKTILSASELRCRDCCTGDFYLTITHMFERVKKSVCYFVNGVVYKRKFVMRLSVLNCSCTRSPLALLRKRLKCPGGKGRGEDGGDGGGGASLS